MAASTQLHELIHSLTPSEKRYFKVYAADRDGKEENKYLQLFNLINKQDEYNEGQLINELTDVNLCKHLSVYKNYLYRMILRSLVDYHAQSDREISLFLSLCQIKILIKKELFAHGHKYVQKCIKQIKEYAFPFMQFIAQDMKRRILTFFSRSKKEELEQTHREIQHLHNQLGYQLRSEELLSRVQSNDYLRNHLLTDDQIKEATSIVNELNTLQDKLPSHEMNTFRYHYIKGGYYFVTHQWENSLWHSQQMMAEIENLKDLSKEEPRFVILSTTMYLEDLNRLNYQQQAANNLYKLQHIDTTSPVQKASLVLREAVLSLQIYADLHMYQEAGHAIRDFQAQLTRYGKYIQSTNLAAFYSNAARFYYGFLNDYESTLDMVNAYFQVEKNVRRQDLPAHFRFLELMCHYELDNWDILAARIRSFEYFLRTRPQKHKIEKLLVYYFRKLLYAEDDSSKDVIMEELLEKVSNLQAPYNELNYSGVRFWIVEKKLPESKRQKWKEQSGDTVI